jgi:hypothetical protein
MKKTTKIELLREHFLSGKTITQLEAIGLYSLFRLAARVHELKQKGWNIITNEKRDANGSVYAEYVLGEPNFIDINPHGLPEFALPSQRGTAVTTPASSNTDDFRS